MFSLPAFGFEPQSLVTPLEIWQTKIPDPRLGDIKVTFSLLGQRFFSEDLEKNRYKDMYEKNITLLTGFISVSIADNPKVPKDCPHVRVRIFKVEGFKKADGLITLWSRETIPLYNGVFDYFRAARTYEISCKDMTDCKLTVDVMSNGPSSEPFRVERVPAVKIEKLNGPTH